MIKIKKLNESISQLFFQPRISMCPIPTCFLLFLFLFSSFPQNTVCFPHCLLLPSHRRSPAHQVLPFKVRMCKFIRPCSIEANPEELAFPLPQIMCIIKRLTSKLITSPGGSQPSSPLICFYYLHTKIKLVKKQISKALFIYIFGSSSKADYLKLINYQRGTITPPHPVLRHIHTCVHAYTRWISSKARLNRWKSLRINVILFQWCINMWSLRCLP